MNLRAGVVFFWRHTYGAFSFWHPWTVWDVGPQDTLLRLNNAL